MSGHGVVVGKKKKRVKVEEGAGAGAGVAWRSGRFDSETLLMFGKVVVLSQWIWQAPMDLRIGGVGREGVKRGNCYGDICMGMGVHVVYGDSHEAVDDLVVVQLTGWDWNRDCLEASNERAICCRNMFSNNCPAETRGASDFLNNGRKREGEGDQLKGP